MALLQSEVPELRLILSGKVRNVYEVDDNSLLFVVSDRLSAFDVVMNNGITDKGRVLNQISLFWFNYLKDICPNHIITGNVDEMPDKVRQYSSQLRGRCQWVRKLKMLPVEVIVRGYITGSGWKEYQAKGTVCGITLPVGLVNGAKLPSPLYTPSTKAMEGLHDENIHPDRAGELIGKELNTQVAALALRLYERAAQYALSKGIIIADTKFEFGQDSTGSLGLVKREGDKYWQYVRDYLESIDYDKAHPVTLPDNIVLRTRDKYIEVFELLTGTTLL